MKKSRSSVTHMEVSVDTREKLKKVEKDIDAKSIDAVVNWLLDKHLDQGDADGAAGMEEEEAGGPRKQRKVNVRDLCIRSKFCRSAKECCITSLDLSVPRSICWSNDLAR
jgi:hypothetical protein